MPSPLQPTPPLPPCPLIRLVQDLLRQGVPCLRPQYLVDWVAHPSACLEAHRLVGCSGKSEAAAALAELEAARGAGYGDDEEVPEAF